MVNPHRARRLADGKLVVVKEIKTTALTAKQKVGRALGSGEERTASRARAEARPPCVPRRSHALLSDSAPAPCALNRLQAATMDEVEVLAKLDHPNIVHYHDCFMDEVRRPAAESGSWKPAEPGGSFLAAHPCNRAAPSRSA